MEQSKPNLEAFAAEKNLMKPILPYSSIQIYATLQHFKHAIYSLVTLKESSRKPLLKSVIFDCTPTSF